MPLFPPSIERAQSIAELRLAAKRRLPRLVFDFFDGGSEDELTLRGNRAAFERVRLLPNVLVDVSKVSTHCVALGAPSGAPLAIAPTGGVGYGRHGGDLAIARAAARLGIPYTLSTSATASIEEVARAAPGRLWFQAYVLKDQDFFHKLIERARAADYEALVITVDLAVGGKRERDVRNGFRTPFRLTWRSGGDVALHPRWAWALLRHGMPVNKNLIGLQRDVTSVAGLASAVGRNYDPSFDWDRLARVRERWPRKLIVKGVVRPDAADRLARLGVDAVVVSNHGGRQLDGGCATLDALPGVVRAVAGRIPVWIDGGVRRGVDVIKARALGAEGVLVGRATLYGAVAGGDAGAQRALTILHEELVRAMKLCGVQRIEDIDASLLAPAA
jgi:(S)-mandelate dehydrogenase